MTIKYYSTNRIDKKNADYNVIFGERSNGKTYAVLLKAIKQYFKDGSQLAYLRRWKEDITGRRASMVFEGINANDEVRKISGGKFEGIHYHAGKWYFCTYDEHGKTIYNDQDIFAYAFALSNMEHDKSTSFPNVRIIMFDEFLTNKLYLPDEFVTFMNVISTIVRRREDVKIYMLGNTVNKYCPYFQEMGLAHINQMTQGTIDIYRYGEKSQLTVAVEYCSSTAKENGHSNKYFAFNNPKLEMITGGAWELNIYPHLPYKYKPKDILLTFFIEFNDLTFQCEVIQIEDVSFIFIHDKTTPIKNPENHYIYSLDYNPERNYNRSIYKPITRTQQKILWFFQNDRVYYQDNTVGDAINNYLKIVKRY